MNSKVRRRKTQMGQRRYPENRPRPVTRITHKYITSYHFRGPINGSIYLGSKDTRQRSGNPGSFDTCTSSTSSCTSSNVNSNSQSGSGGVEFSHLPSNDMNGSDEALEAMRISLMERQRNVGDSDVVTHIDHVSEPAQVEGNAENDVKIPRGSGAASYPVPAPRKRKKLSKSETSHLATTRRKGSNVCGALFRWTVIGFSCLIHLSIFLDAPTGCNNADENWLVLEENSTDATYIEKKHNSDLNMGNAVIQTFCKIDRDQIRCEIIEYLPNSNIPTKPRIEKEKTSDDDTAELVKTSFKEKKSEIDNAEPTFHKDLVLNLKNELENVANESSEKLRISYTVDIINGESIRQ